MDFLRIASFFPIAILLMCHQDSCIYIPTIDSNQPISTDDENNIVQKSTPYFKNDEVIIITEHLILRPKMQANSKAHAFLLPIILALKQMSFQPFLEGERKIEES